MNSYGRLQPAGKGPPRPSQRLHQGHINCFFSWRSSLPFGTFLLHNAVLHRKLAPAKGTPRPGQRLHQGHSNCFFSWRSSLPFATFLLHNAVFHRKLAPTHRSMVYLPCLHVTGHIPFASGAIINIRFLLHNAVLHRKLVPTHRSMVYLPCLHVTGHIPFASGANVSIRFRNDLRVPDLETVTACAAVIYLACAHTAPHRLLASGTNILETLAFLRCFCFLCRRRHLLRRAGVGLLSAAHFCMPVCGYFVFRHLLYVALRAAVLRAFRRYPVLFSVFVPRWPHRHQRRRASFFLSQPSVLPSPALQLPVPPLS